MKSVRWSGPAAGSWSSSKRVKNWSLMRKVSCYTSPVRMLVVSAVGQNRTGGADATDVAPNITRRQSECWW